jgi:hypothetical protein
MKKILLTIAAIALFAVPASAQMYSLWSDASMTACEFYTAAPYVAYNVYLMLDPGPDGAFAAEYMLTIPAGQLVQVPTPSPLISVAMGNATGLPGISLGFLSCQTEPFVVYSFLMLALSVDSGFYMVEPNASTGKLIIANCVEPYRPEVAATAYNYFGFNDACVVGTEESSWGAIKSMME